MIKELKNTEYEKLRTITLYPKILFVLSIWRIKYLQLWIRNYELLTKLRITTVARTLETLYQQPGT